MKQSSFKIIPCSLIPTRSLILSLLPSNGVLSPFGNCNLHIWYKRWILHPRYPLAKEIDWWRQHFCHETIIHFTDQNAFLLTPAEFEQWRQSVNFLCQGDLLVKASSRCNLLIPRNSMVFIPSPLVCTHWPSSHVMRSF